MNLAGTLKRKEKLEHFKPIRKFSQIDAKSEGNLELGPTAGWHEWTQGGYGRHASFA